MKFPGEPQETTYTELTPGAEGGVSVTSYATVAGVSTTRHGGPEATPWETLH